MRNEIYLWLNYLGYDVNIVLHIYWLVFTHISILRCAACGYLLYVVFFLIGILDGMFIGKNGCPILGMFFIEETDNTLFVYLIEETDGYILVIFLVEK